VGNTLLLQGRVYSPPYRITAIGDVQGMRKALDDSAAVQVYREYVSVFQLGYEVRDLGEVTMPAFTGSVDLRYATAAPAPSASGSASVTPSPGPSTGASSSSPSASGS
jgi:uncharacterized protein YlxW (UPF0749 family)